MDTETKLLQQGLDAEALLSNETFIDVMNHLANEQQQVFFGSEPGDAAARETAYYLAKALDSIPSLLRQMILAKDQIIEDRNYNQNQLGE